MLKIAWCKLLVVRCVKSAVFIVWIEINLGTVRYNYNSEQVAQARTKDFRDMLFLGDIKF